ncbi:hypothetical protein Acr_04g0004720 [Actinidia rufa]|uniref:Uncharacterized protein n=1 Tax=Actinidia rufa TaxID=165716 RepID=A0A7J0EGX5_9ERIC|nr:hypothetical protein Acr_04g0004720 [Actinidia rufa]
MATELNEPAEISGRLSFDRRVSEEELESELAESSISLSSYLDFEANFLGTEGFKNASSSIAAASFAPNELIWEEARFELKSQQQPLPCFELLDRNFECPDDGLVHTDSALDENCDSNNGDSEHAEKKNKTEGEVVSQMDKIEDDIGGNLEPSARVKLYHPLNQVIGDVLALMKTSGR